MIVVDTSAANAINFAEPERAAFTRVIGVGGLFGHALAKVRGLPLLYKGDDVARTDLESAL